MGCLRIRMFGPFTVWKEGEDRASLEELRNHPEAAKLLAVLTLYHNKPVDKEALAVAFYEPGTSIDTLNKTIKKLGEALGEECRRMTSRGKSVQIDLTGLDVDLVRLDSAWEKRLLDTAPLRSAVEECHGVLLEGWDERWPDNGGIRSLIKKLRGEYAKTLTNARRFLANASLEAGDLPTALIDLCALRLHGDPAEDLHCRVMETCMRLKAYASAKQVHEEYRAYLYNEHELLPPEKMTAMYESIPRVHPEFVLPVETQSVEIEAPGGTMPVGTRFYIERHADRDFHTALARRDGTILVNGPRQVGKSSLLVRGMEQARRGQMRVVFSDFQRLDAQNLQSIEDFYRALMHTFQRKLSLKDRPEDYWDNRLSANENFEGYLLDVVLASSPIPVVWCVDEADRIFDRSYRGSVFGLFRSWHNARAEGPDSPWNRFVLVLTYSTEARLFIPDLHQSPFNVGTKLTLTDFNMEQVRELNALHGHPLRDDEEIACLMRLIGGHPYLIRLCLYEMKCNHRSPAEMEAEAEQDVGMFQDHLQRLHGLISEDAELVAGIRTLLGNQGRLSPMTFTRLRSAGIVAGQSATTTQLRCGLYDTYFRRLLT